MKKIFWISAAYIILTLSLYSQDNSMIIYQAPDSNTTKNTSLRANQSLRAFEIENPVIANLYKNSVGLQYSMISGYGLNYWRRLFGDFSICFTGVASYNEYEKWTDMSKTKILKQNRDNIFDIGVEFQEDIFISNNARIYASLGGYKFSESTRDADSQMDQVSYTIGIAFGYQLYFSKNVAGFGHFGYKFDHIDTQQNNQPSLEKKTNVGLGLGLVVFF
jgi:hypothetical protein